jgi:hypothetical protein
MMAEPGGLKALIFEAGTRLEVSRCLVGSLPNCLANELPKMTDDKGTGLEAGTKAKRRLEARSLQPP